MRAQPFLNFLSQNYDPQQASALANNPNLNGGWEVWLQVEIAMAFMNLGGQRQCTREAPYPSGQGPNPWIGYRARDQQAQAVAGRHQAARCDFHLHRRAGLQDNAYVELKCINANDANPLQNAWNRFGNDIIKIQAIRQQNAQLNAIALLATYGQFNPPHPEFPDGFPPYVWDPANNNVSRLADVIQGGPDRFFIVAAAAI